MVKVPLGGFLGLGGFDQVCLCEQKGLARIPFEVCKIGDECLWEQDGLVRSNVGVSGFGRLWLYEWMGLVSFFIIIILEASRTGI